MVVDWEATRKPCSVEGMSKGAKHRYRVRKISTRTEETTVLADSQEAVVQLMRASLIQFGTTEHERSHTVEFAIERLDPDATEQG